MQYSMELMPEGVCGFEPLRLFQASGLAEVPDIDVDTNTKNIVRCFVIWPHDSPFFVCRHVSRTFLASTAAKAEGPGRVVASSRPRLQALYNDGRYPQSEQIYRPIRAM
jgi:hypothetical protein